MSTITANKDEKIVVQSLTSFPVTTLCVLFYQNPTNWDYLCAGNGMMDTVNHKINFTNNSTYNSKPKPDPATYYNVMYSFDGVNVQYCSVIPTGTTTATASWTSMSMSSTQSGSAGSSCAAYFALTTSGVPMMWGLSDYVITTSPTEVYISRNTGGVFFNTSHYPTVGVTVGITQIICWLTALANSHNWSVTASNGSQDITCGYSASESPVPPPPPPSNLSQLVKANAKTLNDFYKREVLLAHSDFNIPFSLYSQDIRLGAGTDIKGMEYWSVGKNNEVTTKTHHHSALLTMEPSSNYSQEVLISTNNKKSYIRAVNLMPYVVLMFGASRANATPFQMTFVTDSRILLSTADVKGTGVHTWLTNSEFVYLMKGPPSNYINDDKAQLTFVRDDEHKEHKEHKTEHTEHKKT